MRLLWLPEAIEDLERLYEFLLAKNPSAAERVVPAIDRGARTLPEFPEIGRSMGDETGNRELFVPFGAGAYVLRYRIHGDAIFIIRVWHSREHR